MADPRVPPAPAVHMPTLTPGQRRRANALILARSLFPDEQVHAVVRAAEFVEGPVGQRG